MQVLRLERTRTAVVAVDLQERLLPAIFERERVIQNSVRLIRGTAGLGLRVLATEQYPKGLGRTVPEIRDALACVAPIEKTAFSTCGAAGFVEALRSKQISSVLLCGVEAHVCVCQTCLHLFQAGFHVFVAADAVSSRTKENCQMGLQRMRDAGAVIVSTEMALFELLGNAGTQEFKKILELVK